MKRSDDYPIAYACYNNDLNIRLNSTSGGIFTILGSYVIQRLNGVVYGAAYNENFEVHHTYVDNVESLSKLRGSKYPQSSIGEVYRNIKKFLREGTYVLFTGTPCQVAGLHSFLEKEYENLICMDFVCHGVASGKIWKDYVGGLRTHGEIRDIIFKSKPKGWKKWYFRVDYNDHVYQIRGRMNQFMKSYLSYTNIRPSCYNCRFKGLKRESDFTISDCWGIGELNSELNDNKGLSALLLQNDKAVGIFNEIKKHIKYVQYPVAELMQANWTAIDSVKPNRIRSEFFNTAIKKDGRYALVKYYNPTLREWLGYYRLRLMGKEK